ncbi:M23 family metallopeptidase [Gordonia humi]|uniref:Murein DD-endopeptidase MepM/ murein hydrolase activator NlpD n=1 Tax=Gordonia humi TaxID=686429 RepID=A0A840EWS5_9ACTN|nr:peptidoglycan DD-metalloendopeptidase family protein [Gordonia humi]MBB4136041.1 murein DD-endopeptidase MepM/ murein hydrolase activator NlpD [Gordonia humi]
MRTLRILAVLCATLLLASVGAAGSAPASRYDWPLAPRPRVLRGFDPPAHRWLAGHRGVDLAGVAGAAVLAARAGTVHFAGSVGGKPTVSILHGDGLLTTYEPVVAQVRRGDHVGRGQVVGTLRDGHEGCAAAACLHWGARRGSGTSAVYLDPLGLLGVLRVRLKPLKPEDAPDRARPAAAPR